MFENWFLKKNVPRRGIDTSQCHCYEKKNVGSLQLQLCWLFLEEYTPFHTPFKGQHLTWDKLFIQIVIRQRPRGADDLNFDT